MSEFVYVMKVKNACKIGISRNPEKRAEGLQTGCPYSIEKIWKSIPLEKAARCENAIHKEFRNFNTRGEWFDVPFEWACFLADCVTRDMTEKENIIRLMSDNMEFAESVKLLAQSLEDYRNENNGLIAENNYLRECLNKQFAKKHMSISEASEFTGLSKYFMKNGIRKGTIPYIKSRNRFLINIDELLKTINESSRKGVGL
jgi:excisionase family DNA binding protein